MNYKSIVIVTYGRSGSTLLMNILNNSGCMIYGENANFFYGLFKSYNSIDELFKNKLRYQPINPWFNNKELNKSSFIINTKNYIKDIYGEHNIIGFKEIRYDNRYIDTYDNFEKYLHFLELLFDDILFVFNTRNLDDVKKSKWWKYMDYDSFKELLVESESRFFRYFQKHKENTFHITYDDVINKTQKLKDLYDKIGLEFNETLINNTMNIKYASW